MFKYIKDFNKKILSNYENESVLMKKKVRLVFYYLVSGFIFIPLHFIYMYFFAGVNLSQLKASPPDLIVLVLCIIFLIKGRYNFAVNLTLISLSSLMSYAVFQNIQSSPVSVYSMNMYFFIMIIVQAALFNSMYWLVTFTAIFLIIDIFSYLTILSKVSLAELYIVKTGFVTSAVTIVVTCILSIIFKVITDAALQRAEEETEKNKNQYLRIKQLLDSVFKTSELLAKHSDILTGSANGFIQESQNQAANIEEISSAAEEVMGNMDQVTNVIGGQYDNINNLIEKMDKLSLFTSQISSQISNVNKSSEDIAVMAERGNNMLQEMHSGMNKISTSSTEVKNIISIISDIADRINLLSLNASIEAARAGFSGRGFAVVADEISRLGEETQRNMVDINKLINAAGNEIINGLHSVDNTVSVMITIINQIKIIVSEIGSISEKTKVQQDINILVNEESISLKEKSDNIKIMIDEQLTALNEIVNAIVNINDITQLYVEGSRKLHQNAEDVERMAIDLKNEVKLQ